MKKPEAAVPSPYAREDGRVPEEFQQAAQRWEERLALLAKLHVANPHYLFLPDADLALRRGMEHWQPSTRPQVVYASNAGENFHPNLVQVVRTETDQDGNEIKVVVYIPQSELKTSAVPRIATTEATVDEPDATPKPQNSVEATSVITLAATDTVSGQETQSHSESAKDRPTKNDLQHVRLICRQLDKSLTATEVASTHPAHFDLGALGLTSELHSKFKLALGLQLPEEITAESLKVIANSSTDLNELIIALVSQDYIAAQAHRNNYDVASLGTIDRETPSFVTKLWYFIVNQPKILLSPDKRKYNVDRILRDRWQMLIQLPPTDLVVLYLASLGVHTTFIDTLCQLSAGESQPILEAFFTSQETAPVAINDVRIQNLTSLSFTFASVLTFNPFLQIIESIEKREREKIERQQITAATTITVRAACMQLLRAARDGKPLSTTASFNTALRGHNQEERYAPSWIRQILLEHYLIRAAKGSVNIADLVWLSRAFQIRERQNPAALAA
jgi:hypothetical protein